MSKQGIETLETTKMGGAEVMRPYIHITFQQGPVSNNSFNGCRIDDVIDVLVEKLRLYQNGPLACIENTEALHHLAMAKNAMERRRKLRESQGVFNTQIPHESLFKERTEDAESDFSATGS